LSARSKPSEERSPAAAVASCSAGADKTPPETTTDLFADIFENERDLDVLDSIVGRARQQLPPGDYDSSVGVMSDTGDDSSSSDVCEKVAADVLHPFIEEDVGVMSSSDDSSRDSEPSSDVEIVRSKTFSAPGSQF
jgi:hypothetical protein